MIDGSLPPQDSNIIPLAMFKFERMLQTQLDQKTDGAINLTLLDTAADSLDLDDQLLENVVERVIDALDDHVQESIPTFDYVRAKLRCHCCRSIADEKTTDCETYIGNDSNERELKVGSKLVIPKTDVSTDFYVKVSELEVGKPIHVVEGWWCQKCASVNWAEIVVENDTIRSIWSIKMCTELLDRIHYISSEIIEFIADRHDRPAWSLSHEEILALLRAQ